MNQFQWSNKFSGAFRTNFVGRKAILQQLDDVCENTQNCFRVVFITGEGGIGKTELLLHYLRQKSDHPNILAAQNVVDLYHFANHSAVNLADAIFKTLTPPSTPFSTYERKKREYQKGSFSNSPDQENLKNLMLQAFRDDIVTEAKKRTIIIGLDTAERLVYSVPQMVVGSNFADSWKWLITNPNYWNNVVLLVAGRPLAKELFAPLENSGCKVMLVSLSPFSEEETLDYFVAAAQTASGNRGMLASDNITNLSIEHRKKAFQLTNGHPILLALLVEQLSMGKILEDFWASPPENNYLEVYGNNLVRRFIEFPHIGETIITLGRTPKGCDEKLLMRLLDINSLQARERLEEVSSLSFVKVRQDGRYFLHDDMYPILKNQVYSFPIDQPVNKEATEQILNYYHEQVQICIDELNKLYIPFEIQTTHKPDLDNLTYTHYQRVILLSEIVYYRFREKPDSGFRRFYRHLHEAIFSGDLSLYLLSISEFVNFLAEKRTDNLTLSHKEAIQAKHILQISGVNLEITRNNYMEALNQIIQIRETTPLMALDDGHPSLRVMLDIWEALCRISLAMNDDLLKANDLLKNAVFSLQKELENVSNLGYYEVREHFMMLVHLGLAFRLTGYLQRHKGLIGDAINSYHKAIKIWRSVNLKIHMASTQNDLGYALTESGEVKAAFDLVLDGLELRRSLGHRIPVGLSLNTLGLVYLRDGNYSEAIKNSERALFLFRTLEYPRGTGLALNALAESFRRSCVEIDDPEKQIDVLRQASLYAQEGFDIFSQANENIRQIDSKIELGCAYRDWVKIRIRYPSARDDIRRLIGESKEALETAALLAAKSGLVHKEVDALVNLAWLGYYANDNELVSKTANQVEKKIHVDYRINPHTGQPGIQKELAQVMLWPQLGKLYALYALLKISNLLAQQYNGETGSFSYSSTLHSIAEAYFWSLQYSSLYSKEFRDLQKVKSQIFLHFKKLNTRELQIVSQHVEKLEKENNINSSEFKQFLIMRSLWI